MPTTDHASDSDIIGTVPAVDLGPLFAQQSPAEATAVLQAFTHADPAPAPRAKDETDAFTPPEALTDRERLAGIERIQRDLREPLVALALARKDRLEIPGVTAKDVREMAEARGLAHLVGTQQRAWSWLPTYLATICRHGHLVKYRVAGMVVRRMADNGNEQVVYLHPYDHRAQDVA